MMGSDRSLLLIFLILRNAGIVAIDGVTAGQAPISLDIAPSLPYLVAIITEKANLVKARDAKARVLVRPTKGGMLVQEGGKADPHKIAALPKRKRAMRLFCVLLSNRRPLIREEKMSARRLLIGVLLLLVTGCADPYEQGMQAYEQGVWEEAIAHFERVRKLSGRYTEALAMISKARFQLGKEAYERGAWQEALEQLEWVDRRDENYPEARELIDGSNFHLGKEAYDRREWTEAVGRLGAVRQTGAHYEEAQALFIKANAELEAAKILPE